MLYRYRDVFRTLIESQTDCSSRPPGSRPRAPLRDRAAGPLGVPEMEPYVWALAVIVLLYFVLFQTHGLYEARRMDSPLGEASAVLRATGTGLLLLTAASFFAQLLLFAGRDRLRRARSDAGHHAPLVDRFGLRRLRQWGLNLRFVVVGALAETVVKRIGGRPDAGLRVLGIVAEGGMGGRSPVCR